MNCLHDSHNDFEWVFEVPRNHDSKVIKECGDNILKPIMVLIFCNTSVVSELESEEAQM